MERNEITYRKKCAIGTFVLKAGFGIELGRKDLRKLEREVGALVAGPIPKKWPWLEDILGGVIFVQTGAKEGNWPGGAQDGERNKRVGNTQCGSA